MRNFQRKYQNIILYKETAENPWDTPSKIANTFLNRFVIDEDFACEIIGTYELSNNDAENFGVIHNSLEKASAYRGYSKNIHFVFARNYLSLGIGIQRLGSRFSQSVLVRRSLIRTTHWKYDCWLDKEINDGICLIHFVNNEKTYFGHERPNDTDHSEPGMTIACSFVFGTRSCSN